jgi:hypothetical protein
LGAIGSKSKVENKLELRPGRLILLHSAHLLPTVAIFVQLEVAVSCSPMLMSCVCIGIAVDFECLVNLFKV